jgi:hypothetical protein
VHKGWEIVTSGYFDGIQADPERWAREQEQRTAALRMQAETARAELGQARITETSRDESLTLTVNPAGVLLDVAFNHRAEGLSSTQLGSTVMETYRRAQAKAAQRTTEIMAGLIGEDSDSMAFLKSVMPPPPGDSPSGPAPRPVAGFEDDDQGFSGFNR